MMRSLIFLLVLVASVASSIAHAAWWQDDWKFRKQISVDTTAKGESISGKLEHAGVLVRLHTGNFSFDGVSESGADLRFVAADGKTVLNYQIDSFDPLLGIATIWVDVPEISGNTRQDIWMYYGNHAAPAISDSSKVFDADYLLVYHFNSSGDVSAPKDATAYANNAQASGVSLVESVIGKAALFSGKGGVSVPASQSMAMKAGAAFTFSAWVRSDHQEGAQAIYSRRDGDNALLIGLDGGVPFVEVVASGHSQRVKATQPLGAAVWQHLAVAADGEQTALYVNGKQVAALPVALPALTTAASLGVDADSGRDKADLLGPFLGALDEVRLSKVARSAQQILVDAASQGSESRLVVYGADEEKGGINFGGLAFLMKSVPVDAWVVIAVLVFMMVQSWIVMLSKFKNSKNMLLANQEFRHHFIKVGFDLEVLLDKPELSARLRNSSLWRLYQIAVTELRARRTESEPEPEAEKFFVSAVTIEAIRASMDAARSRESQQLSSRLGILSNAVAGAPYIGLLGTVLGIMLVFLGTAMAGDVNINAVAPGMASALLATAMGLFVAIPALFGYNYLIGRNRDINTEMRVFVDEFVTRLAEVQSIQDVSEVAAQRSSASVAVAARASARGV